MPLNNIIKYPEQEKWRTIQTSNTMIKPIIQIKKEAVETFLVEIGF